MMEKEGNGWPTGRAEESTESVNLKRHAARCGVCRHPQRAELEREFLDWISPREIAEEYKVSKTTIYRHAEATGLLEKRRRNMKFALDRVVERSGDVEVTASAVISAIRLLLEMEADRAE